MSGQFTADPVVLDDNGTKLQTKAGEFKADVTAIYNTVEEMIVNDYISKEAVEIGRKILFLAIITALELIILITVLKNGINKISRMFFTPT